MKRIINLKIASLMMLLGFFAIPLFAQPGGGQGQGRGQGGGQGQDQRRQMTEQDVKDRVARLSESLECSDEQETEILEFDLEQYKTAQVERQKLSGDREAMRAYMMKQRDVRDKKYAEILTKEQLKKYNELMEERRNQRQNQSESSEGQRGRGR